MLFVALVLFFASGLNTHTTSIILPLGWLLKKLCLLNLRFVLLAVTNPSTYIQTRPPSTQTHTHKHTHRGRQGAMEMIRSSEDHGGGPPSSSSWVPRPRLLSDPKSLSTSLLKKEVIVPHEDEEGSSRQQEGCRTSSGPCALSCLVGRAYTIYVVQVRYKDKGQWQVRKRFRELVELNNTIQDGE